MTEQHEVFALHYATRDDRTRADSFIFDDDHASVHRVDYFVWVLRNEHRTIVVDTGFDHAEAARRGRTLLRDPIDALAELDVDPERVTDVVITHLHYDHAGSLDRFPVATFHLQVAEMAFATGPCMCHATLRAPYTADHVCDMVRKVFSGRVRFHDGAEEIAPGVEVHRIGGHSRGLQCVRVATRRGPLVLASDASHYYENFEQEKPFPIVDRVEEMLEGFRTIKRLAGHASRVIPGHDPLVAERYPLLHERGYSDRCAYVLHADPSA